MNERSWIRMKNCNKDGKDQSITVYISQFVFTVNIILKGTNSALLSVAPLDTCIANAKDFQIFHSFGVNTSYTRIGFDSFSTLISCQIFLSSKQWNNLIQSNFANVCVAGNNSLIIDIVDKLPSVPKGNSFLEL